MAKALLYNFSREDRRKKVKAQLFRLAIPSREVPPEEQDQPVGWLLGLPGFTPGTCPNEENGANSIGKEREPGAAGLEVSGQEETDAENSDGKVPAAESGSGEHSGPGERFTDEMIVMHELNPRQFNGLLDGLRRAGVSVPLKAVTTQSNISWTGADLYRELKAEHAAVSGGGAPLHQSPRTD